VAAAWPRTDVLGEVTASADGVVVSADTAMFLLGTRTHVHSTTIQLAVDRLLSRLLRHGEDLAGIEEMEYRNLSGSDVRLTASASPARVPRVRAPAVRGALRTDRGRALFVEGAVLDRPVSGRAPESAVRDEILRRIGAEDRGGGGHATRVAPLGPAFRRCTSPLLARHATMEVVLEGTRTAIRARLGSPDGQGLVVAGWKGFAFPRWRDVARGSVLSYTLSDAALSSGTRLVHCDFAFPCGSGGRLTVARLPARPRPEAARREP
jgi:hypothetical protein